MHIRGFTLASFLCASAGLASANTARPAPAAKTKQVVVVAGKNLCYGSVPAPTRCDFTMPVPSPAKDTGVARWLKKVEAAFAAQPTTKTK